MAIINVTIFRVNAAGVITSISAGPDQYVICAMTVTLTATVIGDLTGHTVLWEQISGPTDIIFITPTNQLIVQYTTTTFFDRTFRFYIDKLQPGEIFDDVIMFGTPTSFSNAGVAGDETNILASIVGSSFPTERVPDLKILRHFPELYDPDGSASCNQNIEHALSWTMPGSITTLTQFLVQRLIGGVFVTIATLPATARMYITGILPNTVYRVVAIYDDRIYGTYTNALNQYPSIGVFTTVQPLADVKDIQGSDPTVAGVAVGDDGNVRVLTYSVVLLTVDICDNLLSPDETSTSGVTGDDGNSRVLTYTVILLTLDTCDNLSSPDETNAGGVAGKAGNNRVVTYAVVPLGGGSIGG